MNSLKAFWDWFIEHRDTFYDLQALPKSDQAYYFHELSDRLEAIGPTLSCVIKFAKSDGLAELTVTTNGHPEGVILVKNLVNLAPNIPQWTITAFIQPIIDIHTLVDRSDPPYQFDALSFKASDLVWVPNSYDEKTGKHGLLFGFTNLASILLRYSLETVNEYVSGILFDLLGELLVCQKVAAVDYYFLKPNMDDGWLGLELLPGYLQRDW